MGMVCDVYGVCCGWCVMWMISDVMVCGVDGV